MDRRKFIESTGRWGLITLLALIAGILIRRNAISLNTQNNSEFCTSCSKKSSCKTNPLAKDCHPEPDPVQQAKDCHPGLDPGPNTQTGGTRS